MVWHWSGKLVAGACFKPWLIKRFTMAASGVLVEVPVMLSLVAFANRTRHWFTHYT